MSNPLAKTLQLSAMPDWLQSLLTDDDWRDLAVTIEPETALSEPEFSGWPSAFAQDEGWAETAPETITGAATAWSQSAASDLDLDIATFNQTAQTGGDDLGSFSARSNGQSDLVLLDAIEFAKGGVKGPPSGGSTDPVDGVLDKYTSGLGTDAFDTSDYNIDIVFKGTWTQALQQAFIDAAEFISSFITGDVFDIPKYRGKSIDDIRIDAELTEIDGTGGILGQAGPTAVRSGINGEDEHYLPATAIMQFDVADAENYLNFGGVNLWDDIVIHEMLHSIGFGTIWDYKNLVNSDSEFIGGEATDTLGSSPLVQTGGGHWSEAAYGSEIMSPYINLNNYMDGMTLASLADLGYVTQNDYETHYDSWVTAGHEDFLAN